MLFPSRPPGWFPNELKQLGPRKAKACSELQILEILDSMIKNILYYTVMNYDRHGMVFYSILLRVYFNVLQDTTEYESTQDISS